MIVVMVPMAVVISRLVAVPKLHHLGPVLTGKILPGFDGTMADDN